MGWELHQGHSLHIRSLHCHRVPRGVHGMGHDGPLRDGDGRHKGRAPRRGASPQRHRRRRRRCGCGCDERRRREDEWLPIVRRQCRRQGLWRHRPHGRGLANHRRCRRTSRRGGWRWREADLPAGTTVSCLTLLRGDHHLRLTSRRRLRASLCLYADEFPVEVHKHRGLVALGLRAWAIGHPHELPILVDEPRALGSFDTFTGHRPCKARVLQHWLQGSKRARYQPCGALWRSCRLLSR
mmetsp:Transcript_11634/g.29345  ORF Transcript_11634/g.29345 Transcript_11634/m.29345 type:complete len:239 (+) Transcript_11634:1178-1894(+)